MALVMLAAILVIYCLCTFRVSPNPISCATSDDCQLSKFPIKYPFGLNSRGCGDPNFQIDCAGGYPVLNIKNQVYQIDNVVYEEQKIEVYNQKALQNPCYLPSVGEDLMGSPFQVAQPFSVVTFLLDCPADAMVGPNFARIGCSKRNSYLGFADPKLTNWSVGCASVFHVPTKRAELGHLADGRAYSILREPFAMQWRTDVKRDENCRVCQSHGGICGYNVSDPSYAFLCYGGRVPRRRQRGSGRHGRRHHRAGIIIIIIGACVGAAVLIATGALLFTFYYSKTNNTSPIQSSQDQDMESRIPASTVERFLEDYSCTMPKRYSYVDIEQMADNFSEKLGQGAFGVVYKGQLSNGRLVAVKVLDESTQSVKQFMNEVGTIGRIHHVHLVRLLGYCFEGSRRALIYEYMANGSLDRFIFASAEQKQHILDWKRLHAIALGASRGIAYLHNDCDERIIHFDIKPHNILLDEQFSPKVSDFGLAKLCNKQEDHVSMTIGRGTPGYVAPEVYSSDSGPVTDKSDVYSYGMLLLEMVGGRKNLDLQVDASSQLYFPDWAFDQIERGLAGRLRERRMEDDIGMTAEDEDIARRLTIVGLWCIQHSSSQRPSMNTVVHMLEGNFPLTVPPPLFYRAGTTPETDIRTREG